MDTFEQAPAPMPTPPPAPAMRIKKRVDPKDVFIAIAIILAGIVLALSVYVVRLRHKIENGSGTPEAVRAVSPSDHIIGNPSAPIVVIEYGDIDSSYTKQFQLTMEQIMTEYLAGGKVAWVYRHFPLTTEHANAGTNALAAECVSSLGSGTIFFRFIDAMQSADTGDSGFDPANYAPLLSQLGVSQDDFTKCMTNATLEKRVHDDYSNALASGATGSPFIILEIQGKKPAPVQGAIPYTAMKKILDDAIANLPK